MFLWFGDDDVGDGLVKMDIVGFHGDDLAWDSPSYQEAVVEEVLVEGIFVGVCCVGVVEEVVDGFGEWEDSSAWLLC